MGSHYGALMATPGAIAVYTSGSGLPDDVRARPWRGVYHHWDGYPGGLGAHLIRRVQRARGKVGGVVRALIDEAPFGWSTCYEAPLTSERSLMSMLTSLLSCGRSGARRCRSNGWRPRRAPTAGSRSC